MRLLMSRSQSLVRTALHPRRPFDPAASPFFYGWVIAIVGTLGIVASIPGQTTGLSVFSGPLREATGLDRLGLANAYLVGTICSGLMLPLGGRWIDRWGVRLLATLAACGLAAAVTLLSAVETLVAWLPSVGGVSTFVLMTLLFTLLRFTGQGMLTLTSRTMIARWFDRHRGLISAAGGAVIGFTFSIAPMTLLAWMERATWQGAWREIALLLLAMAVIALLLYRDDPEEVGLEVDGSSRSLQYQEQQDATGRASRPRFAVRRTEREATRAEAVRTLDFWLLTGAVANQSMIGTAATFHIVDLASEAGLPADVFVRLLVPVSLVSIGFGFAVGYLVDRIAIRWLIGLMLVSELVMFLGGWQLDSFAGRVAMIVGWGVAAGCYGPLTAAALPRLFGRVHLGAISGVLTMCLVIASALGPSFLALFESTLGSYRSGFLASAALPSAGLLLLLSFRRPSLRREAAGQ